MQPFLVWFKYSPMVPFILKLSLNLKTYGTCHIGCKRGKCKWFPQSLTWMQLVISGNHKPTGRCAVSSEWQKTQKHREQGRWPGCGSRPCCPAGVWFQAHIPPEPQFSHMEKRRESSCFAPVLWSCYIYGPEAFYGTWNRSSYFPKIQRVAVGNSS